MASVFPSGDSGISLGEVYAHGFVDNPPLFRTNSKYHQEDQYPDDGPEVPQHQPQERTVTIYQFLARLSNWLWCLSRFAWPSLTVTQSGCCLLVAIFFMPRIFTTIALYPAFRLIFGTLYPAYASYKAVRTKNIKEYVKWMMHWIVFALFTAIETVTDIFLAWFPFYYEVKVIMVLWLLSPVTKGSSTLYRKFVHPTLTRREQEIDEYIAQCKEKGYTTVLQMGSKGINYATSVIMQTAIKGGGSLVHTLRKSYSVGDLSEPDLHRSPDELDEIIRPDRHLRSRTQSIRSNSHNGRHEMYFPEVDVVAPNYTHIRSSEDISSGYSSAEPVSGGLSRTASLTNTVARTRLKSKKIEDNKAMSASYSTLPRSRRTEKNIKAKSKIAEK